MSKVHEALRRAEREREEARRAEAPAAAVAPERHAASSAARPAAEAAQSGAGHAAPVPDRLGPDATAEPATMRPLVPDAPSPPPDMHLAERLVAFTRPRSLAAEQYRAIRQQLAAFGREMPIRTIVVTSPVAGEGKTTTAANLAVALGQDLGRRVCLVDGDLRNPQLMALFGLSRIEGLADVLRRRARLDAVLVPTPINGLRLLPAGHVPPNPAELLGSAGMREIIASLRSHFDLTVLDSPPVLPLPDPAIAAGMADGVVMVVQAGRTPRRLIDRALDRLHGAVLLGFVLNRTDEFKHYAGYYSYDYGA